LSNIGIFGGTFNPPHKGHVNLAKHAIDKLCLERLYIIPSNIPPHKTILNDVRGKDRLEMAKLAFSDIPNSAILDIELKRGGVSYTIDTVIELKKGLSEEDRIYLLMGNDMLEIIEKWHRFEELFKLCRIAVFKRNEKAETGKIIEFLSKKYNAEIIEVDCPVIDISSTDIRDMDINSMKKVLPTKVLDYILKHHLYEHSQIEYFKKILSENLSEYRYEHSLSVSREAVKLAEIYGVDKKKAEIAGLLHDITKEKTYKEQLKLCSDFDIILSNLEKSSPKLLHAKTGAYYIKNVLKIYDDEIFNAVYYHTTGRANMSPLESIIFLADYIAEGRDFEGVEKIRKYAYTDLTRALMIACDITINEVREKNMAVHDDTLKARNFYAEKIT